MRLDVSTLAFSSGVVSIAAAVTIVLAGRRHAEMMPWRFFAASTASYAIGIFTIIAVPSASAFLICGNMLVLVSFLALHAGLCRLAERRLPLWAYGAAMALLVIGYSATIHNVTLRLVVLSILRVPFYIHGLIILSGIPSFRRQISANIIYSIMLSWMISAIIRSVGAISSWKSLDNYFFVSGGQATYFAVAGLLHFALAIAVLFMTFEQEERILNQRIDEQTKALSMAKDLAETASAAKTRFLAAAGHDLRQATHALGLQLSVVTHELSDGGREQGELVDLTADMGLVIASMTDQLNAMLEMARLDCGVLVPRVVQCPVLGIFEGLKGQFGQAAIAADVDLRFIESSALIRTDPAMFSRIMGNMIDNALKFAKGRRVVVGCRRKQGRVVVCIVDDGCGISRDHIDHIFDEYYQADGPARSRSKGFGLGLAIVRRMSNLLGHHVSVYSRTGSGSAFSIET